MISTKYIQNLTLDNITDLELADLESAVVLRRLKELSEDPQLDSEAYAALNFFEHISNLVEKNSLTPESSASIENLLQILVWKAFPLLNIKMKKDVLTHKFLQGLYNNIDVKLQLFRDLRAFEFGVGPDKEKRRDFINSLDSNVEMLGSQDIILEGKNTKPFVRCWIALYNSVVPIRKLRGKFEQLNFIQTNSEVRKLNVSDRTVLQKVLEIHDWLLFPPAAPEILPEEGTGIKAYSSAQQFTLPPQTRKDFKEPAQAEKKPALDEVKLKDPVNLSKPLPVVSKTPFVLPKSPGLRLFEGALEETKQIDGANKNGKTAELSGLSQAGRTDIIDSKDRSNNANDLDSIKKDIENKKTQAQAEIEKKLTSLKTRSKSAKSS